MCSLCHHKHICHSNALFVTYTKCFKKVVITWQLKICIGLNKMPSIRSMHLDCLNESPVCIMEGFMLNLQPFSYYLKNMYYFSLVNPSRVYSCVCSHDQEWSAPHSHQLLVGVVFLCYTPHIYIYSNIPKTKLVEKKPPSQYYWICWHWSYNLMSSNHIAIYLLCLMFVYI